MDKFQWLLPVASALGAIVLFLFGGWDMLITILFATVVIDYTTGLLSAFVNGEISSKVGLKGIAKKVFIFALVAVANFVDQLLGDQNFIRDATIIFYILNELISILENAGHAGVPIPKVLTGAIQSLKQPREIIISADKKPAEADQEQQENEDEEQPKS